MRFQQLSIRLCIFSGLIAFLLDGSAAAQQVQAAGLIINTTYIDFTSAGALFDGTFVRENGGVDGASIALLPLVEDSFTASTLDTSTWNSGLWSGLGSFTPLLGSGVTIPASSSAYIRTINKFGQPTVTDPQTVEFSARFLSTFDLTQQAPQNVGFGLPILNDQFIVFSTFDPDLPTQNTGHLYARIKNYAKDTKIDLGTTYIGVEHRYRIDWYSGLAPTSDRAIFFVDGVQVADQTEINITSNAALPPLYVYISNKSALDALNVSSIKASPGFRPSGSYTSTILDAGLGNVFTTIAWVENKPANSGVSIETSSSPDLVYWSSFQPVGNGAHIPENNRYIKYRLTLTTSDPAVTPQVDSVSLTTDIPHADLNILKAASSDAVSLGGPYSYTFTIHNYGPDSATGLLVSDLLPGGVTFDSFDASTGWNCSQPAASVICAYLDKGGSLGNGDTSQVKINVKAPSTGGTRNNQAMLAALTADPNPANNTSNTVTTIFTDPADLALTMTSTGATLGVGQSLVYTIHITNNGPTQAQLLKMVDNIPAEMIITAMDGSPDWTCGVSQQTVTCAEPVLASGTSPSDIRIYVTLPMKAATLTNSAMVNAQTGDPDLGNNSAQLITRVANMVYLPEIAR